MFLQPPCYLQGPVQSPEERVPCLEACCIRCNLRSKIKNVQQEQAVGGKKNTRFTLTLFLHSPCCFAALWCRIRLPDPHFTKYEVLLTQPFSTNVSWRMVCGRWSAGVLGGHFLVGLFKFHAFIKLSPLPPVHKNV